MKKVRCNKADELYCFLKTVTRNDVCWHSKEHEYIPSCEVLYCLQGDKKVKVKCVRVKND